MYKIIDNFLEKSYFLRLKENILYNGKPWFFSDVIGGDVYGDPHNACYFNHTIFDGHIPTSDMFNLCFPLFDALDVKALIRCKLNLYPHSEKIIQHGWHRDIDYSHKGAVLYINNNNGYTIFEDGTKIESVENRILLFDSSKLHASSTCSDVSRRVTLNLNYF